MVARPVGLELFKFAQCVYIPVSTMLHFSEPDRLDTYLEPLKANYVHPEKVQVEVPTTRTELQDMLSKIREERSTTKLAEKQKKVELAGDEAKLG